MDLRPGMLDWLETPTDRRAIRFARDDGEWDEWTYARLATATYSAAEQLRAAGVKKGDVVAVVIPSGPLFAAAYFGALTTGAIPAPLIPPTVFEDEAAYRARTTDLLGSGIDFVASEEGLIGQVQAAAGQAGVPKGVAALSLGERSAEQQRCAPAELALLQFTSGSSGRPRAVRVSWENLETNIAMIIEALGWGPQESGAHWLPLYHDMGLIGCLLSAAVNQRDGWSMRPEQFVMQPLRWLDCFGRKGANLTAGPTFAFSYLARKVKPESLAGSDFSDWRAAIVGAERLDPGALARFAALLSDFGFSARTFRPAYGLAEATLAATMLQTRPLARAVRPDWGTSQFGKRVTVEAEQPLGHPVIGDGGGWLVGCGEPLPGVGVTIRDEAGEPLPEGHLGEICITGPTVAHGYQGASASLTHFEGDRLMTGDAGFLHEGELYCVGRLGDALKVRGKTLYAEDLEAKLSAIDGVPLGRCAVLPGAQGEAALTALVESGERSWVPQAARVLHREAGAETHVVILSAGRGTILRTSSGKLRRRAMWQAALDDDLAAVRVYDSRLDEPDPASAAGRS